MSFFSKLFSSKSGDYDARVRDGNEGVFTDALKEIYGKKILPLEKHYNFKDFFSTPLEPAYFDSKPMVLLFGEYSTGKTSFIRHLIGKDYPGMRIGPEPTTDSFIVVEYGDEEKIIPGNAAVVDKEKQFGPLVKFGSQFLNRFQLSTVNAELLENVILVDTPGILSGEKERGYDLTAVLKWFTERSDRIILLFDINKLDISDELKAAIDMVKGYEDKVRIVLNKCDTVNTQQLMRVYGALMWSLGKVLETPEAARVYIGSFWGNAWMLDENRVLFEKEETDLIVDIHFLPKQNEVRKLNDLVRRAMNVKIHSYVMAEMHKLKATLNIGADRRKKQILSELDEICHKLSVKYNIPRANFPPLSDLRSYLSSCDFSKIKSKKEKYFRLLDQAIEEDLGRLMTTIRSQAGDQIRLEAERQLLHEKIWSEKVTRKPGIGRSVSHPLASNERDANEASSIADQQRYQRIVNRSASYQRSPIVVTREDCSSAGSLSSGCVSMSAKRSMAPSPRIETRTIVTRTESTTAPNGEKLVKTETSLQTPERTEFTTTERIESPVESRNFLNSNGVHVVGSYGDNVEHESPTVENLYATIQRRQQESPPPEVQEKKFESDSNDGAMDSKTEIERIIENLEKVSEVTTETTEVTVQEKTTVISTSSTLPNSEVTIDERPNSLNVEMKDTEEISKLPNGEAKGVENDTSVDRKESSRSREEQRRKFLFGTSELSSEPAPIIASGMEENYDQRSIKDYDGIIHDEKTS